MIAFFAPPCVALLPLTWEWKGECPAASRPAVPSQASYFVKDAVTIANNLPLLVR
jgi:hypothetical protein